MNSNNVVPDRSVDTHMIHCMDSPYKSVAKYFSQGFLFPLFAKTLLAKDTYSTIDDTNKPSLQSARHNFSAVRLFARTAGFITSSVGLVLGITAAIKGALAVKAIWTTAVALNVLGFSIPVVNIIYGALALACLLTLLAVVVARRLAQNEEVIFELNDVVTSESFRPELDPTDSGNEVASKLNISVEAMHKLDQMAIANDIKRNEFTTLPRRYFGQPMRFIP